MATQVTIPRSVRDPAYRYRMPALQQKIEGRGINTHTTLVNLREVAKALRVPALYILKFMGYDWGAQSIYKVDKNDVHTSINGVQDAQRVLESLDKFIEKFVLCAQCGLPELHYVVEAGRVTAPCNSCGAAGPLDAKHKLTTYIARNPPQNLSDIRVQVEQTGGEGERGVEERAEARELRAALRPRLAAAALDPRDPAAAPLFEALREYLAAALPLDDAYEFDDSHTEIVYKALKRLRLPRALYDRVPYVLFSHLFGARLLREIPARAGLFEGALHRHKMEDFIGHEVVLNLAFLLYRALPAPPRPGYAATAMKLFFEENLLSEAFLEEWVRGQHDAFFATHALYSPADDARLRADAADFLEWLRGGEDEGPRGD